VPSPFDRLSPFALRNGYTPMGRPRAITGIIQRCPNQPPDMRPRSKHPLELTGQRFGRLVAIERAGTYRGAYKWLCLCDCGRMVEVLGSKLVSGHTKSCGCIRNEYASAMGIKFKHLIVPGNNEYARKRNTIHGQTKTPAYRVWMRMRARAGTKVCKRWQDFGNFLADVGPKPSPKHILRRSRKNGYYSPKNCQWFAPGNPPLPVTHTENV
jgi:hypothetical protein